MLVYFFRQKVGHPGRLGRIAKAQAFDAKQKVKHLNEADKAQPDDVTLARKVETEIFRDADVPKGQINVNAENGVVVLRGEVEEPELIRDLEAEDTERAGRPGSGEPPPHAWHPGAGEELVTTSLMSA